VEQEAQRRPGDCLILGALKERRLGPHLPGHRNGAAETEGRHGDLRSDDQDLAGMVEERRRYRTPMNAGRCRDIVHIQHLGDKSEVCLIVGEIAEGDQRDIEPDGGGAENLGKANGKHAGLPCADRCHSLA
jgi:hypothetical protein